MKQTKAHEIYVATRVACKKHIEVFGLQMNPNGKAVGWNNLVTEEAISTRTINAVEKEMQCHKKDVEIGYKLGVYTDEEIAELNKMWMMVESTIENARAVVSK